MIKCLGCGRMVQRLNGFCDDFLERKAKEAQTKTEFMTLSVTNDEWSTLTLSLEDRRDCLEARLEQVRADGSGTNYLECEIQACNELLKRLNA